MLPGAARPSHQSSSPVSSVRQSCACWILQLEKALIDATHTCPVLHVLDAGKGMAYASGCRHIMTARRAKYEGVHSPHVYVPENPTCQEMSSTSTRKGVK